MAQRRKAELLSPAGDWSKLRSAVLYGAEQQPTEAPTEPVRILGDIDGDGDVTVIDVTLLQRHLAGISIPYTVDVKLADVDGDEDVTILDVTYIQRWLAGIITDDNIGKPVTT